MGPITSDRTPSPVIGELFGAQDRQFDFNLNRPSTIQFNLPMEMPHAFDILGYPDGLITLRQNGTLRMTAEISSLEIVGDEDGTHSIGVTAVETMWPRFQHILVGRSSAGLKGPATATDQGTWLISTVLAGLNTANISGVSTHTGVGLGTVTASNDISGGVWRYTPFLELIQELAASVNGFDFWQVPADPSAGTVGTAWCGTLWIAPLKGTTKSNVVFEYGTELPNAATFRVLYDSTEMINRAISLPPSFPDSAGLSVLTSFSTVRGAATGVREEVIPMEFKSTAFRQGLINTHQAVRRNPRSLFEIQPMPYVADGRVPQPLVDYTTGDTVLGRIKVGNVSVLDALVRVYGIRIAPDDVGAGEVTLSLVNEA